MNTDQPSHSCRSVWMLRAIVAAAFVVGLPCGAQEAVTAMDYAAAQGRLMETSDALRSAEYGIQDKRELAQAARRLRMPDLRLDAQWVDSKKTIELPLGPLEPLATQFGLDSPLRFEEESWRTRPIVRATLPLYTGGAIPSQQRLAGAAVHQAEAERQLQENGLVSQLVQAYYGQALAERVLAARREARDGMASHLRDTLQLEKQGFATRAQRLQAQVANDQAERDFQRAAIDLETARQTLALLLRTAPIDVTSPLFVIAEPIGTRDAFREMAGQNHPQLARLEAIVEQSRQGVKLQQAKQRPEVFAFGQYDGHKEDATLVEPDWAIGIGVRYALIAPGRRQQIAAAQARESQAESALDEVHVDIDIAATQAFDAMSNARIQFTLLESAIAQAEENLRLQTLSFREGQATSLDVIDARLALANARVSRAQAAYQFDVALSRLLEISGQAREFERYAVLPSKVSVQ